MLNCVTKGRTCYLDCFEHIWKVSSPSLNSIRDDILLTTFLKGNNSEKKDGKRERLIESHLLKHAYAT